MMKGEHHFHFAGNKFDADLGLERAEMLCGLERATLLRSVIDVGDQKYWESAGSCVVLLPTRCSELPHRAAAAPNPLE